MVSPNLYIFSFRVAIHDSPPSNLHNFMRGSHEYVVKLLVGEDHFEKVKSAVNEMLQNLESKRCRLESELPSPSDYAKVIQSREGICDHRFFSDLHVGLQVQAFGNFVASMKSEEFVDSKYYKVAATLMQNASRVFLSEGTRINNFTSIIQELGEWFRFQPHNGFGYKTDCTVFVRPGLPIANWEFKNEFFNNSSCPICQNNAYFIHLQKERNEKDRSPMLLVSVVGCHYLQVFGAVWNGERCMCVDPLCSPISLLFVPRVPNNGVSKLAQLLSVIDKTMGELKEYYDKPMVEGETDIRGPYWTGNGHLEYNSRLSNSVMWLFEATLDGNEVVVKFVRSHYGEAVHKLLGDAGFAPKLISCQLLPGGWYAVVMEKLVGCHNYY